MLSFQDFDEQLFRFINGQGYKFPAIDWLMVAISSHAFWLMVLTVILIHSVVRNEHRLFALLAVMACALAISDPLAAFILKPLVARLRPCHALTYVQLIAGSCGGEFGFPSNHAVNAGAVTAILTRFYKGARRRWVLLIGSSSGLAVCLSRVWLGVHYPADVAAGFILGTVTGGLVAWFAVILDRRRQASSGKKSFFD